MKVINNKTGKEIDVRLPIAFKRKWVKALRSGEFKQGSSALKEDVSPDNDRVDYRYCCLGVACEIQGLKTDNRGFIENSNVYNKLKGITKIPKILLGSDDNNPVVSKLVFLNDTNKWSFKKIATWIEKNL